MAQFFDFSDRTVVLTGAASGMGAAALTALVDHGAQVWALDRAYLETGPSQSRIGCDLSDEASIDAALDVIPDRVDVLINCAGVPNGGRFSPATVMAVNWLGLRSLTESVLGRMPAGSSVVHIASTAGRNWPERIDAHRALMAAADFASGAAWVADNPGLVGDGYSFSKEAVQYYTQWRAVQLLPRGIRMNSVCPGITDTSIIGDFRRGMGDDVIDHAAAVAGRIARPDEMTPSMLFLADEAASSYLNGVNLNVDRGTAAARLTDQSDPALIWG